MNSIIYRCGWCGSFTDKNGSVLNKRKFKEVEAITKKYGDRKTQLVNGHCCPNVKESNSET